MIYEPHKHNSIQLNASSPSEDLLIAELQSRANRVGKSTDWVLFEILSREFEQCDRPSRKDDERGER